MQSFDPVFFKSLLAFFLAFFSSLLALFASSLKKLCFGEKKIFEILVSEYSEWSKTSSNIIFSWCPNVCMCVRARLSNFQTTIIRKRLEISNWNLVQQWSSHAPLIVEILIQINAQSEILWDLGFFEKCLWYNSSDFRKFWAIVLKMHTNIIHRIWPKSITAFKFFEILNFLNFSLNCKLRVIELKICVWMH